MLELSEADYIEVMEEVRGRVLFKYTRPKDGEHEYYVNTGTGRWRRRGEADWQPPVANMNELFDEVAPGAIRRGDKELHFPENAAAFQERAEAERQREKAEIRNEGQTGTADQPTEAIPQPAEAIPQPEEPNSPKSELQAAPMCRVSRARVSQPNRAPQPARSRRARRAQQADRDRTANPPPGGSGDEHTPSEDGSERGLVVTQPSGDGEANPCLSSIEQDIAAESGMHEFPERGGDDLVLTPDSEIADTSQGVPVGDEETLRRLYGGYIATKVVASREQVDLVHKEWLSQIDWQAELEYQEEYDYLVGEPAVHEGASAHFLCHVLMSGSTRVKEEGGWVPIPSRTIMRDLKVQRTEHVWRPLQHAGLLEVKPHVTKHLVREFRIKPELRDQYYNTAPTWRDSYTRYNLISGRKDNAKLKQPYVTDSDGEPINELVQSARVLIWETGCLFDVARATQHVNALEREYRTAERRWKAVGRPRASRSKRRDLLEVVTPEEQEMIAAQARWHHDRYCLDEALLFEPDYIAGSVRRYQPRFARNPQSAGRVTEIGGFQSASRELKQASLGSLKQYDVRNYDLKSSQVHGLIQLFDEAGADFSWLERYLNADKETYAEAAFGSRSKEHVDLWKRCLLAMFMGGVLPESTAKDQYRSKDGEWITVDRDIGRYLREAFGMGVATDRAEAALASFREVVGPFEAAREQWHTYLAEDYASEHATGRGGNHVPNAVGVTLDISELEGWSLKSKLAAHLLQGLEAEFIHRLTILSREYDFRPMSNQHDGLVTEGEIPAAAINEAAAQSKLENAPLVEKSFV